MPDASWGYTAEQGLKAVLGGEGIDKINRREGAMSPEEMRTYIEDAPEEMNVSYSDEARRFAKAVLVIADKDLPSFLLKCGNEHDFLKEIDGDYGLTGFMYGWAVNAVRYAKGANAHPNPAILTIRMKGGRND